MLRVHARQIGKALFRLNPLLRAILTEKGMPEVDFLPQGFAYRLLQPDCLEYRYGLVLALDLDLVELAKNDVGHKLTGPLPHDDANAIHARKRLQARTEIHGIPHYGICAPHLGSHVAHAHHAAVHADPDPDGRPIPGADHLVDLQQPRLHAQRG